MGGDSLMMTHPKGRPWTEDEKETLRQEQRHKRSVDYQRLRHMIAQEFRQKAEVVGLTHYQLSLLTERINLLEGGPKVEVDYYTEDGITVYRDYPDLYEAGPLIGALPGHP